MAGRIESRFSLRDDLRTFKRKMLNWAEQFSIFSFLDNNEYNLRPARYECILAVSYSQNPGNSVYSLDELEDWHRSNNDWLFGHISYDYKNSLEPKLRSKKAQRFHFPDLCFFCPDVIVFLPHGGEEATIISNGELPINIFRAITTQTEDNESELPSLKFIPRIDKTQYLEAIDQMREHIRNGDCYEVNYCVERYCEGASIPPIQTFQRLNALSPMPFAACYRLQDKWLLSASPERYLFREGRQVVSQPMKGTARRHSDPAKDEEARQHLRNSVKEMAENVMIVDLVRNDLSRSCRQGSIRVDELFSIYSFPGVHQMISTISGELEGASDLTDPIRYSFPMGSMTGAPKFKVMELIEHYEVSRRELFSGAVGYIDPNGDFDFNVVIRSLFYHETTRYLSFQTGGAITFDSVPLEEFEEMQLKAWAIESLFKG